VNRLASLIVAGGALVAAFIVYQESRIIGFPDGHVTELDHVRKTLGLVFIGISCASSLAFFALFVATDKHRTRFRFATLFGLYFASSALLAGAAALLPRYFAGGGGG